jgi:hypothetical protein
MSRRADDLAEDARALACREPFRLVQLVIHDLADREEGPSSPSSLIG